MNRLKNILILLIVCGLAGACGVRGPLEPAPGSSPVQQNNNDDFVLDDLI